MTKFRRNHKASRNKGMSGFVIRALAFVVFILFLLYLLYQLIENFEGHPNNSFQTKPTTESEGRFYLPVNSSGEIVHHRYYSLSYNESTEQSNWVAYELKREELKIPNVKRAKQFLRDNDVSSGSAHHKDYSHSGYTRGHLAPAGDMAFNELAMQESFYMSNMSPQLRAFNNGIWKELEENIRDWGYKFEHLYIVTGPIFRTRNKSTIGQNEIAVPSDFFKIILDATEPEKKAVAFLIPNALSERPLREYAVTIDEVENLTGFDFFANLLDERLETKLESNFNISKWPISQKRFNLRVNDWNHQK